MRLSLTRPIQALLVLAGLVVSPLAQAQAPLSATRFSGVQVDTRGLAQNVGPNFAARIQQIAGPMAERVFADRLGGSGPLLVLRIDALSLGPMTGEKGGGSDYVRGAALVVAQHRVVASYPVRGAPQSLPGTWTLPDMADQQRFTDAVAFFTGWARRNMGL
jgi:hypothetical protein